LTKFNNRSKKSKENLENTLGEREPLRVWRSWGEGKLNLLEMKGFGGEDPKSPREPLAIARDGVEEKKRPKVLKGGTQPPYIGWKPKSRTCPASWICPSHRPDMSSENCLDSFENFRNYLKKWYSTDFGVGPIEYIYVWHTDMFWKEKHIYMTWDH
jgi:hypothetical protein